MQQSRTRYLPFISLFIFLFACSSPYRKMQKISGDPACIQKFRPRFNGTVYNTKVDVVGKHLSGLLLIKTMPDSSTRIVFTSELGFKFFDFGFSRLDPDQASCLHPRGRSEGRGGLDSERHGSALRVAHRRAFRESPRKAAAKGNAIR